MHFKKFVSQNGAKLPENDRGEYGLEISDIALSKVRPGEISKRKPEQMHKVPRKTINRHLNGLVANPGQLVRFRAALTLRKGWKIKFCSYHILELQQVAGRQKKKLFMEFSFGISE